MTLEGIETSRLCCEVSDFKNLGLGQRSMTLFEAVCKEWAFLRGAVYLQMSLEAGLWVCSAMLCCPRNNLWACCLGFWEMETHGLHTLMIDTLMDT